MGAVFSVFAAFYFWYPILRNNHRYSEFYGVLHFWTTFLGVNITFFPMHFLGLAGMPRRIPDYPDSYVPFNIIASYGSLLTTVSTIVFFFIAVFLRIDLIPSFGNKKQLAKQS